MVTEEEVLEIGNRRYYGNKTKLIPFIKEVVQKEIGENWKTFVDLFSGTGAVANAFNDHNKIIISNDLLFHNFCAAHTWLKSSNVNISKIKKIINKLNRLKGVRSYVTKNFSWTFVSEENAKKIDSVREEIEILYDNKYINLKEKYVLLTSLFYAIDKCSNIITQYESYLKEFNPKLYTRGRQVTYHGALKPLKLKIPNIINKNNYLNKIFNDDANELILKIKNIDILYLDPPYTCRQYCDNYHFLENIVVWNKPKVFGVAKKMDTKKLKSKYSYKSKVLNSFKELIFNADAKYILMSYSNNGLMNEEDILCILRKFGKVKIFLKDYNGAHICTSKIKNNKEKLFLCISKN